MNIYTKSRDWASQNQGFKDWDEAVETNSYAVGIRIGLIMAGLAIIPAMILFLLFLLVAK